MDATALSLREFTGSQLQELCKAIGFDEQSETPSKLLHALLGPAGDHTLSTMPSWASEVADDTTPIEFSVAFDDNGERAVRILGETIAEHPSTKANMHAAKALLESFAERLDISLERLRTVEDLFLPDEPQGFFAMWYSFIFRPNSEPQIKIYFNPEVRGAEQAPALVAEALDRLGLDGAYQTSVDHALRRGNLDRFTFFALDLNDGPRSRVKLYISHEAAHCVDAERAASAVPAANPASIREFCSLVGGGKGPFDGRPLISSYAFVEGDSHVPSNYSLYLPIRDYVSNDAAARRRVVEHLAQHSIDYSVLDDALAALTTRQLDEQAGLIAHVSLRLGAVGSGTTVYLSSEAFGGTPVKQARVPATVS